ncbi:methionyl-tRNA formyltransferase [Pedobacter jeongneungensis]|uniref:methionyl-tRNA formyltransferase n=1 Tax=Pedobacter jeongneungensis TaxID=947309 RepID=UPI000A0448B3|nr:formyltransferase family protein [Pedobacter jeongneungensis]
MKIIIFSNHLSSIPVIDYFNTQGLLKAIVSTDKLKGQHLGIENFCNKNDISFFKVNRRELLTVIKQLFVDIQPDVVIMFGFSYRIPADLYEFPTLGFFNVHFSMLPAYQGPDPLFWQMKNGETSGGVSIHKVDSGFDTGAVVMQEPVTFIPGETWGIADSRHSLVAINMIVQLIAQLSQQNELKELAPDDSNLCYYARPKASDLTIDWETQTATQVEALVNACNPGAGGAVTTFKQQIVKILEVSQVEAEGEEDTVAGTITYANDNGLYVQCVDKKILRINILKLNEGFMTGFKLAAIGIKAEERFENSTFQYQEINN